MLPGDSLVIELEHVNLAPMVVGAVAYFAGVGYNNNQLKGAAEEMTTAAMVSGGR